MNPLQIIKLILAITGLIAFFLPWIDASFAGQFSGYTLLEIGIEREYEKALLLMLLPFSFLLVAIFQFFKIKGTASYLTKIIEFIPIIIIVIALIKGIEMLGIRKIDRISENELKMIGNTVKIGVYLNVITAFSLVFFPRNKFIKIEE